MISLFSIKVKKIKDKSNHSQKDNPEYIPVQITPAQIQKYCNKMTIMKKGAIVMVMINTVNVHPVQGIMLNPIYIFPITNNFAI